MSNKSPIFPMSEIQQHFSDYGFHPHFDYFQVSEEARKQRRENPRGRFTDSLHNFKLQKPIINSQEDYSKIIKKKKHNCNKNRNQWWKHALHFFKAKWTPHHHSNSQDHHHSSTAAGGVHPIPVYITESRSGSSTPYRTTSRSMSGSVSPAMRGEMGDKLQYISLRDINNDQQHRISASSPMPIYLVT